MTNITQTPELQNFMIYRNNEIDADYYALLQRQERRQRLIALGHGTLHVLAVGTSYMAKKAGMTALEVYASMYDALNETDTRHELTNLTAN